MADILVLDDILDSGVLIKCILERQGHTVFVHTEEHEAMDYVRTNRINLAILDLKLRSMTGIEVLKCMKQDRSELKVIMLTGYPTLETAREALRLGANAYCVKPIDKVELENSVRDVLENE